MKHWLSEGIHTFSVTTLHPIRWGMQQLQGKMRQALKREGVAQTALLREYENPIVLVHGIFHNVTAFYQLEKSLRKQSFQTIHSIDLWTSLRKMEDLAEQLKQETRLVLDLAESRRRFNDRPLKARLVAHSLGGMIARVALLDPLFASLVDKVVFLGTPHQGSRILSIPVPPCLKDLEKRSPMMKRLRAEPLPGRIRYYNLRGELDFFCRVFSSFFDIIHAENFIDTICIYVSEAANSSRRLQWHL